MKLKGSCLCGEITYSADTDPLFMVTCSCKSCQRACGSSFTTNVLIQSDSFKVDSGECATYSRTADSGNTITRHFCPNCGSNIYGTNAARKDRMVIRTGTLDDTSWVKPGLGIWRNAAMEWTKDIDFGFKCLPRGPE